MPSLYSFDNPFKVSDIIIPNGQLTSDVTLLEDDGFLNITYSGTTTSRWIKFVNTALSDVVEAGLINKTGGTTRFTDNEQDVAATTTLWINDNLFAEQGSQVWQNDNINFIRARIDIIQDAATTPVLRSYRIVGDGRQTTLARQPGSIRMEVFRIT